MKLLKISICMNAYIYPNISMKFIALKYVILICKQIIFS